ncbi:hypothetical protein [Desulfovibrio ferrophilus]|uniref:Putative member of isochorismatase hydrolase family n=1 Tax=Desulfovibrio ferrophilus TaxID=241368 RepID=A0A2Z6B359_9BACT|nr:hypothetical protein [Desulfovibrio ferrophilus]BBD09850.1 putative member of isochorismatase hydrolase family [Desulfovibrio ferrophilus]
MNTFTMSEPCELRPIRFMELLEFDGWRIKVYGIAYGREEPRSELMAAARVLARRAFPRPACEDGRYGVGYLGVHDGRGSNFVFTDWWADENELHHHVFISPSDDPEALEEFTATGVSACIWDMKVMCFERDTWVKKVLRNPDGPDLQAYLETGLEGEY